MPRHIRKGDEVMITAGDFKGQTGTVVQVLTKKDRVVVSGSGIRGITRNLRPTRVNPQGGQVSVDRSFHISNVSPVAGGKPSRVRFEVKPDGSKVRIAARNGAELGKVRGPRSK
ncbi:MAG: 50S ribosomal protein L24 [Phycisphaerales bacterium]